MTGRQLRMAITGPGPGGGSQADGERAQARARQPENAGAGVLPLLSHALDQALAILAADGRAVRFTKSGEQPDPVTGKPVADTVGYDYDDTAASGDRYRVTFRREHTIVQDRMIDGIRGPGRVLAHLAGFDGTYLRFTGQVDVESRAGQPGAATASAPRLWELMYFGKTLPADPQG